jgi:hypothetical protein
LSGDASGGIEYCHAPSALLQSSQGLCSTSIRRPRSATSASQTAHPPGEDASRGHEYKIIED